MVWSPPHSCGVWHTGIDVGSIPPDRRDPRIEKSSRIISDYGMIRGDSAFCDSGVAVTKLPEPPQCAFFGSFTLV